MTCGAGHSAFRGNVDEGAVPLVAIQNISAGRKPPWAAHHREVLPFTEVAGPFGRCLLDVEVNVVRDKKIEITVSVVIDKGASGAPSNRFVCEAGFLRNVLERAASRIPVEHVVAVVSNEQVGITIVVVIAGAGSLSPSAAYKICAGGDVGKTSVPVIPVKVVCGFLAL